jgi:hypothetical protein
MERLYAFLRAAYACTIGHPYVLTLILTWLTALLTAPVLQRWVGLVPLTLLTLTCLRAQSRLAKFLPPTR